MAAELVQLERGPRGARGVNLKTVSMAGSAPQAAQDKVSCL